MLNIQQSRSKPSLNSSSLILKSGVVTHKVTHFIPSQHELKASQHWFGYFLSISGKIAQCSTSTSITKYLGKLLEPSCRRLCYKRPCARACLCLMGTGGGIWMQVNQYYKHSQQEKVVHKHTPQNTVFSLPVTSHLLHSCVPIARSDRTPLSTTQFSSFCVHL